MESILERIEISRYVITILLYISEQDLGVIYSVMVKDFGRIIF